VIAIGDVPYKRERSYVSDEIARGKTLARSNPHVQTLLRAAGQGVKSIQEFNKSVDLQAKLHD